MIEKKEVGDRLGRSVNTYLQQSLSSCFLISTFMISVLTQVIEPELEINIDIIY